MANESKGKIDRVLGIYTKLMNESLVKKEEEVANYNVNERSIQKDMEDIRRFLENSAAGSEYTASHIYDWKRKGYCLEQIHEVKLSDSEVLAVCKILLDSRAFTMQGKKESPACGNHVFGVLLLPNCFYRGRDGKERF